MNNNTINTGYSEAISMLRFPLAVLVVFIHNFGSVVNIDLLHSAGISGPAIYDYTRLFISQAIARSAVPVFFMISGFLMFLSVQHFGKKEYFGKLRKRIHTLIIPYFVWITLLLLANLAPKLLSILLHGAPWSSMEEYLDSLGWWHIYSDTRSWGEITVWTGQTIHSNGPLLLPFWYMRDLIALTLLSPVIYWLVKRIGVAFVLLLVAIYAFYIRVPWLSDTFATATLFYSIGAYWGITKQDFTDVLWKYRSIICPIAITLMAYQTYRGSFDGDTCSQLILPWMVISVAFTLIIVASRLAKCPRLYTFNKRLAKTSFFVYAAHPFILGTTTSLFHKILPMDNWGVHIFNYIMGTMACVGICVAGYYIMERFMPSILGIMIGNRKMTYSSK